MFQLGKKSLIVTGSGSGIGKAIAQLFAKQGASVFIFDINEKTTKQVTYEKIAEGEFIKLNSRSNNGIL
jgi:2-keto-3-deoxy-L-fuconate dehydrogenase